MVSQFSNNFRKCHLSRRGGMSDPFHNGSLYIDGISFTFQKRMGPPRGQTFMVPESTKEATKGRRQPAALHGTTASSARQRSHLGGDQQLSNWTWNLIIKWNPGYQRGLYSHWFIKPAQSLTSIYKHLSLYPQVSAVFTPHHRDFSAVERDTTTENPQPIPTVNPSPNRYLYKTLPRLRLGELCRRAGGTTGDRGSWSWLWDCAS